MESPLREWIASKTDVLAIEYHTWWPYQGDPFYLANPTDQSDRVLFSGVISVPTVRIDGPGVPSSRDPVGYENLYLERKAQPSAVRLDLEGRYDPGSLSGTVTATIASEIDLPGKCDLWVAVIEDPIDFESPNGVYPQRHVFRTFLAESGRTRVQLSPKTPTTVQLTFSLAPEWVPLNISLIAFLQGSEPNSEIEQAAVVHLGELVSVAPTTWGAIKASFGALR
jgi:hypothetical protein